MVEACMSDFILGGLIFLTQLKLLKQEMKYNSSGSVALGEALFSYQLAKPPILFWAFGSCLMELFE